MKDLEQQVHQFVAQIRNRPDFATTPALQKMIGQIEHYGPKLFAARWSWPHPRVPRPSNPAHQQYYGAVLSRLET